MNENGETQENEQNNAEKRIENGQSKSKQLKIPTLLIPCIPNSGQHHKQYSSQLSC
jgi:hypothetical protein